MLQKHKFRFSKKMILFQGRLVVALSWVMEGLTIVREVVALSRVMEGLTVVREVVALSCVMEGYTIVRKVVALSWVMEGLTISDAILLVVYPRSTNSTIVITNIFQNLSTEHVLANLNFNQN